RDTIEELAEVGGIALRLIDTAGIRTASDEVEKIGIERSKENIRLSDLCLFVIDSSAEITGEDMQIAEALKDKRTILIINKTDKKSVISDIEPTEVFGISPEAVIYTSAPKGETACGIDALEEAISDMFTLGKLSADEVYLANERQRDALLRAQASIKNAMGSLENSMPFDLLFIDLEDALSALGEVTGETVQEEIIDKVFENFCVGK
ncbi:MAG: GTP-binding protein, partial [Clostridia bacterium]|nr:GTP-binding protein [Clostridia bacterium]